MSDYFNNPEIPTWANYIRWDKDGDAFAYEQKPSKKNDHWLWSSTGGLAECIPSLNGKCPGEWDKIEIDLIPHDEIVRLFAEDANEIDQQEKSMNYFDNPDMSERANHLRWDEDGEAYVFSHKPRRGVTGWLGIDGTVEQVSSLYDKCPGRWDEIEIDRPTAHPHAENMRLFAEDAAETDKPWERWQRWHAKYEKWKDCSMCPRWEPSVKYRRKPAHKEITIVGITFHAPETEPLKDGQEYYSTANGGRLISDTWSGHPADHERLRNKLVFLRAEDALARIETINRVIAMAMENAQ